MGQVLLGKAVEEDAEVLPFLVEGAPESTKLGNCATAISLSTRVLLTTSSPHQSNAVAWVDWSIRDDHIGALWRDCVDFPVVAHQKNLGMDALSVSRTCP